MQDLEMSFVFMTHKSLQWLAEQYRQEKLTLLPSSVWNVCSDAHFGLTPVPDVSSTPRSTQEACFTIVLQIEKGWNKSLTLKVTILKIPFRSNICLILFMVWIGKKAIYIQ